MSDLGVWTVIIGLGIATYLIRFSFIGILAGRRLPPAVMEALGYVPVAILPALVGPMILLDDNGAFAFDPPKIVAAAMALAVGAATRSLLAATLAGMGVYILAGQIGL